MSKQYDDIRELRFRERVMKEALSSTPNDSAIKAKVTKAELAAAKENWLRIRAEAEGEGVIFTEDEEREKMVDDLCYAAMKARQYYKALKKGYELRAQAKDINPNAPVMTTQAEKTLSIRDVKRIMTNLVPGQEITWVTITEQVLARLVPGEEALALHALIPQLKAHREAKAEAISLLTQAIGKPDQERETLTNFFNWIRNTYKLSPRKKRGMFARKIREMEWDWNSNPVDKITGILAETQLTWEDVIEQPALREELEAAIASKLNITLKLEITQRSPEEWKQAITEIWERVKNVTSLTKH